VIEDTMSSQDTHSSSDPEITVVEVDFDETVLSGAFALTSKDISIIDEICCPPSVADPLIGMVVADRYRIIEAIGRGGMGIVYMVEHVRIGKLLAMKLLRGELSCRPDVVRRFKREALCVSRLQSPNTVQVFDFGVSEGLTYLVMELVHGQSLTQVLQTQGPMPAARLGKIVIQMCSSLAEAHRKGIVHRDIKPDNVMLVAGGGGAEVAKVLDFGLAKLREAEGRSDVTAGGMILGTPCYMAPEQIRGQDVDQRSDVYSIGALMYRALTGYPPFGGEPLTVLSRHLHEAPVPPHEEAPKLGIPLGMSLLVMRALAKDPAERFQRVEDLQSLLVQEILAAGSSSVESLLDTDRVRRLAAPRAASATSDEVDAYERKLRRKRHGAVGLAALVAGAAVATGILLPREARFRGAELEPNDTAAEATALPLGQVMRGQLGKRVDERHGDRDFYSIDLPASASGAKSHLRLQVSSLPTMATCVILYKPGFDDAVGQYCGGRPGRDLAIPVIALDPGRYLLVVLQDLDARGGERPPIQESISDSYTILAESVSAPPESEPSASEDAGPRTSMTLDPPWSAALGWTLAPRSIGASGIRR
jgi:eukaryotic-like serine/threonine-protein kinase